VDKNGLNIRRYNTHIPTLQKDFVSAAIIAKSAEKFQIYQSL